MKELFVENECGVIDSEPVLNKCRKTALLRKDIAKGQATIPDNVEREARIIAHQQRIQKELRNL